MRMTRTISIFLGLPFVAGFGLTHPGYSFVKRKVLCPDDIATMGYYRNYSYGFSVSIPYGLKGFWNSAGCVKNKLDCVCMGDHGRFIPIDSHSYLEVFVGVQNAETTKESIDEKVESMLKTHREKQEPARILSRGSARLGGVSATRLKLRYRDTRSGEILLEDSLISPPPVGRDYGGFLYSVTLVTPEKLYSKRKALLRSVVRSWKFRPLRWISSGNRRQ